ncbi:MAG: CPBP family intramembrane metalloprotease [Planctomycetota bacterium]|nr:MAG: CPBP family intramembrane metalloprotease [Planctomycetota bacterium]
MPLKKSQISSLIKKREIWILRGNYILVLLGLIWLKTGSLIPRELVFYFTFFILTCPPFLHALLRKEDPLFGEFWSWSKKTLFCLCLGFLLILFFHLALLFYLHNQKEWMYPKDFPYLQILLFQLLWIAFPEEYFFRAYLQQNLEKNYDSQENSFFLALLESSLLFALAHGILRWHWSGLAVFFPSLLFGYAYQKSKALSVPIIIHGFANWGYLWIWAGVK